MFNPVTERISTWAARRQSSEEEKMELIQRKRIQDLPLLQAAQENDIQQLKKLLEDENCDPFQRGAVGETALHVAVQNKNLEAAEILLDEAPQLINQAMTSDLYQGQTVLHIAAVNQDVKLVIELIHRGANVSSPRATGSFFALKPKNLFYFGEHILTFAACVGDIKIMKILLDHGADLHAKDTWGNTVLHVLVLQPSKSVPCQIIDFLLSQDGGGTLMDVPNMQGLTPMKLAAVEGNVVMFQHLMEKKRKIQWTFGPVTTSMYDVSEIDAWEDQQSVFELIASSNKKKAYKILSISPVKELLQMKWKSTGRPYMWTLGIVYILYMICVSLCCVYRPLKPREDNNIDPRDITLFVQKTLQESYLTDDDRLRLVGEMISVIGAVLILLSELSQTYRFGLWYFVSHTFWKDPFNIMRLVYSCVILAILVMRLTNTDGEIFPMSVALVVGWCYVMYFARGFQMMGPFTIIIQKIAASDLLKLCWLMAVVVCAYSAAFYVAFQTVDGQALGSFYCYIMTVISTYCLFSNLLNGPANYSVYNPTMYSPLYCSFCVIAFLLIFNILLGEMGDTQSQMAKKKQGLWKAEISGETVKMEKTFPKCLRFGSKSRSHNLGEPQYISVEERKWQTNHRNEDKWSSSDEEPDENILTQILEEQELESPPDIGTDTIDGTEDQGEANQHDNNIWKEEIFNL